MKQQLPVTPFLPYVTMEQMLNYASARPETHTASPLANAVCDILEKHPAIPVSKLAKMLALDRKYIYCVLKVETGCDISEIRLLRQLKLCREYIATHPKWRYRDLLPILGLHSSTSLWRFMQKNKKYFPELSRKEQRNQLREAERQRMLEEYIMQTSFGTGSPQ